MTENKEEKITQSKLEDAIESCIKENVKMDWEMLSSNPNMSEAFFERHIANPECKVVWFYLSKNKFTSYINRQINTLMESIF